MTRQEEEIKILFVIEQFAVSYKYFENIFVVLRRRGKYKVDVLNLVNDDAVNSRLSMFCNRIYTLQRGKPYKTQVFTVRKIIKQSRPHIIHAHEVIPSFYAAVGLIAGLQRIPLIFHRHHSFYRDKATVFMEKIAFRRCNIAISVSKAAQQQAFTEHPRKKNKIVQVYNGIDLEDKDAVSLIPGKYNGSRKILLIARLRPRKGHFTAIEAMPAVLKKVPDAMLFFAGEGGHRHEIEQKIIDAGMTSNVVLLGDVKHLQPVLEQTNIVILPSESEAFNLSVLETFAGKKLCIASALDSIKECIENEVTGVLVRTGDVNDLAEKIVYYLKHEAEREQIAANSFELYKKKFTVDIMVNNFTDIYLSLL